MMDSFILLLVLFFKPRLVFFLQYAFTFMQELVLLIRRYFDMMLVGGLLSGCRQDGDIPVLLLLDLGIEWQVAGSLSSFEMSAMGSHCLEIGETTGRCCKRL